MTSYTALVSNSITQLRQLCRQPASAFALRAHRTSSRTSDIRQSPSRSRTMSSTIKAASTTALPDIDERLSRYEWDRMNLADLTGEYQCRISRTFESFLPLLSSRSGTVLTIAHKKVMLLQLILEVGGFDCRKDSSSHGGQRGPWLCYLSSSRETKRTRRPHSSRSAKGPRVSPTCIANSPRLQLTTQIAFLKVGL